MIRRLICILRSHRGPKHRPRYRREWRFRSRVVWMTTCFHCGVQLYEGNSDGWIIPESLMAKLVEMGR